MDPNKHLKERPSPLMEPTSIKDEDKTVQPSTSQGQVQSVKRKPRKRKAKWDEQSKDAVPRKVAKILHNENLELDSIKTPFFRGPFDKSTATPFFPPCHSAPPTLYKAISRIAKTRYRTESELNETILKEKISYKIEFQNAKSITLENYKEKNHKETVRKIIRAIFKMARSKNSCLQQLELNDHKDEKLINAQSKFEIYDTYKVLKHFRNLLKATKYVAENLKLLFKSYNSKKNTKSFLISFYTPSLVSFKNLDKQEQIIGDKLEPIATIANKIAEELEVTASNLKFDNNLKFNVSSTHFTLMNISEQDVYYSKPLDWFIRQHCQSLSNEILILQCFRSISISITSLSTNTQNLKDLLLPSEECTYHPEIPIKSNKKIKPVKETAKYNVMTQIMSSMDKIFQNKETKSPKSTDINYIAQKEIEKQIITTDELMAILKNVQNNLTKPKEKMTEKELRASLMKIKTELDEKERLHRTL